MKEWAGLDFETVIEQYGDLITHIAYLRMGNEADAKDIFQSVFIKLYEETKVFHSREHLKAWLIQTCVHACIDEQRKFWRKHRVQLDELFYQVKDEKQKQELYELMELPVNQRNVLYLYYYQGYGIKEIATLMQCSENTVKSWMRRGKQKLRILLGGTGDEK